MWTDMGQTAVRGVCVLVFVVRLLCIFFCRTTAFVVRFSHRQPPTRASAAPVVVFAMAFFVPPDTSSAMDVMMIGFFVFYILSSLFGNRLKIPFLTRDGGLMTYSKFAKGVSLGPNVSTRTGMLVIYGCLLYTSPSPRDRG